MTIEESLYEIREACARGMAYAKKHEEELKQARIKSLADADAKITNILSSARFAIKHSLNVYENFRKQISEIAVTSHQYENSIRNLTDILKV